MFRNTMWSDVHLVRGTVAVASYLLFDAQIKKFDCQVHFRLACVNEFTNSTDHCQHVNVTYLRSLTIYLIQSHWRVLCSSVAQARGPVANWFHCSTLR